MEWGSLPWWGGAPARSPSGGAPAISPWGVCTPYGRTSEPPDRSMFWSGILAAACSLFCVGLMAADVIGARWYQWNKSWIGCKFFPINAMTLGLLNYATSVSVETQEPMPGLLDQLAKFSGVVFICISMNHAMPSLGKMGEVSAFFTNVLPLGLLVANTFYKVWAQCRTELVLQFENTLKECTIVMASIFGLLISHWLITPSTKKGLESQFDSKHEEIVKEVESDGTVDPKFTTEKLKMYVKKYWLMALTCSLENYLQASGVAQSVPLLTFAMCLEFLRSLPSPHQLRQWNCWWKSDYKWSTAAIFFVQLIGILLGILVALSRCLSTSLIIGCHNIKSTLGKYIRHVMQTPRDWNDQSLSSDHGICRGLLFYLKNVCFIALMLIHVVLVIISWLLVLYNAICRLFVMLLRLPCFFCNNNDDNQDDEDDHLHSYVLKPDCVGGDEQSVVKKWKGVTEKWIRKGGEKKPNNLKSVLEHLPSRLGSSRLGQHFLDSFKTVVSSDEVLKNCWSLHLMTTACIVKAIGSSNDVEGGQMEALMKGVLHEGYRYAMLVDKNVLTNKPSDAVLLAAEMVNERLRYRNKWVNLSLSSIVGSSKATITRLKNKSSKIVNKYEYLKSPSMLPLEAIAARSMEAVTQGMLIGEFDDNYWQSFEVRHLKEALAVVLAECLAYLPQAIFHQCSRGSFGSRDSAVKLAAEVLGETEEILNYLEKKQRGSVQL